MDYSLGTKLHKLNNINLLLCSNPSSDILNIKFLTQLNKEVSINISNCLGQKMYNNITAIGSNLEINIANYPNGTYTLKSIINGTFETKSFVINH